MPLPLLLVLAAGLGGLLGGCGDEDCVNCVQLPPPVVPTGVFSVSGDSEITVYWNDISYAPYDGSYNENVAGYRVYSRFFEDGDQYDAGRTFYLIAEVAWNENYDPTTGLHWYVDTGLLNDGSDEVFNGGRYEYAVSAYNAAGGESALSFELVTDAPLPISVTPVELFDLGGGFPQWSGFDFSALEQGRVDPRPLATTADVFVEFSGGVPYLHSIDGDVRIQDFGVFTDDGGNLVFEGVSWAPADGYSTTGVLEIVAGHIYVVEIYDSGAQTLHYAKLGVTAVGTSSVVAHWAYQTIDGLPELSVPGGGKPVEAQPVSLRL